MCFFFLFRFRGTGIVCSFFLLFICFVVSYLLEEVVRGPSGNVGLPTSRGRVKLQEGVLQCVVQFHYGCLVPTTVTVVWSGEYCNHISVVRPVVSLHDELMSAGHECKSIGVVKRLCPC